MGAARRQHHRQEQAKRDAAAEANRMKAIMEEQQRALEEQLKIQREAMMKQTEAMREAIAPDIRKTNATLGAQNLGVRTSRARRQSTAATVGRGISSLRIPLNIGGDGGGGLNIG
jgi:hypothetical protein